MNYLLPIEIEEYAEKNTSPLDPLRQEVLDYTLQNHAEPQMISGALQGIVLSSISIMMRPKRILEIGTFTGFSALCLAEGLTPDGKLFTLEMRDKDADTAQKYFDRSPIGNKINLIRGNAKEIIPTLDEEWDLIFIDADKTGYIEYYELTLPKLRQNGFILADNVLFHGEVLQKEIKGKSAIAISEFNEHVNKDNRTEQVMLSIRDGLTVVRKK